jgi:hypothetical protein
MIGVAARIAPPSINHGNTGNHGNPGNHGNEQTISRL